MMKTYNKLFAILAVGSLMASCAEQDVKVYNVEEPQEITDSKYLLEYGNIKDYVDRTAYPNFKIACALGANDYNDKGVVYRVANYNFDEITLGNAMKYASVVGDDGNMNFSTINTLLDNAEKAGMSVYGHTLAWHAQQNKTWLKKLMDDIVFPVERIIDEEVDYSEFSTFPYDLLSGYQPTIENGYLTSTYPGKAYKYYLIQSFPTEIGTTYSVTITVRSEKAGQITIEMGDSKTTQKVDVGNEFRDITLEYVAKTKKGYIISNPSRFNSKLEYQSVRVSHMPINHRPQTEQEIADTLTHELNRWVYGMMEACNGRVKAWDLVNEAISGADSDGDGWYDLQHASTGSASDFFWQDYVGDEQYVPIVSKAARAAFAEYGGNPSDLKLFANDYNLESDWDNNAKLRGLIHWVDVWEKNGATIDGLSSQMHISYYEDKGTMRSKADHVVKMLKLMAATGKLVRISELDMGYVDINGSSLKTEDLTAEQHQNMANYYRFIVEMYLKLVPSAQQYSICQWCVTDAPASSGWRGGEPVGLWDLDWNRKPAYAAYCEALKSNVSAASEDYFQFLSDNGLTHYITTVE